MHRLARVSIGWLAVLVAGIAVAGTEPWNPRGPPPDPSIPSPVELEARGALIGHISVVVEDIFDRNDPHENGWIYRLADQLHANTRESAIRAQLVFAEGEKLKVRRLEETERILRGRKYLFDAWVRVIGWDGERADVEVRVRDVWTLDPGIDFSRAGSENSAGFDIADQNFLGRGKYLELAHVHNVDRSTSSLSYGDPNLLGSRWQFSGEYDDQSDGYNRQFQFGRPFYSLVTPWAVGLSVDSYVRTDSRYELGQIVDQYRHREDDFDLSGGWSPETSGRWIQRFSAGYRYDESSFTIGPGLLPPIALPPDRRFSYPYLAYDLIQDAYDKTRNQDQLARTEDLYYGAQLHAEFGYMAGVLGADRSAEIFAANLTSGYHLTDTQSIFPTASVSGRLEDGSARNLLATMGTKYYWRWDPLRVFYVSLTGTSTHELDPDNQLLLGGDSGLRGYPIRYQNGTSLALLTIEQRFYTNWFPFRLFNVGGAAFFDAGRTWGRGLVPGDNLGLLRDAGLGLRFGNARSGLGNVVHVDLSYALDGPPGLRKIQVTVQTEQSF